MSAPGRRAASRRIFQELVSTHGTPVGPADVPPPRDMATPGHSPWRRATPAGGAAISATCSPACFACSITGARLASLSTSSQLMGVPLSRPTADGDFHEPGHRIGVHSAFIWSHVTLLAARGVPNATLAQCTARYGWGRGKAGKAVRTGQTWPALTVISQDFKEQAGRAGDTPSSERTTPRGSVLEWAWLSVGRFGSWG